MNRPRTILLALLTMLAVASSGRAAPPRQFSAEAVDKAIERGVKYLWSKYKKEGWTKWGNPWPEGSEEPGKGFRPVGPEAAPSNKSHAFGGYTALAVYTLLTCGEDYRDERIQHAINWMTKKQCWGTYSLGVRMQIWAMLPDKIGRGMLKAEAERLVKSICQPPPRTRRSPQGFGRWGTYTYRCIDTPGLGKDNSVTQFGVLGVWAAARKGLNIPTGYWQLVYDHFRYAQRADGGWSYANDAGKNTPPGDLKSTQSMTTAGIACMYIATDYLHASKYASCGAGQEDPSIKRGLAWLDQRFNLNKVEYYYLYGVERVGLASGNKYFAKKDWYKLGTAALLKAQQPGGNWSWALSDDCFALLFLARGRSPIMFNHLRYEGDWNNRPRALANLTHWAGAQFEQELHWQNIDLQAPVNEWHDSQILLISGAKKPSFSEADRTKLGRFVHQGGTIVSVAECGGKGRSFDTAMRELYGELFPAYELTAVTKDHPIAGIHFPFKRVTQLWEISNGVRPLVLHTRSDLLLPWQKNLHRGSPQAFQLGVNAALYVNDLAMGRPRGSNPWPAKGRGMTNRSVSVARIKYSGNWDPEPLAWQRFKLLMASKHRTDVTVSKPMTLKELDAGKWSVAAITGTGPLLLSDAETAALKSYVQAGGTVLLDAAGGSRDFGDSATALLEKLFGVGSVGRLTASAKVYDLPEMKIPALRYRKGKGARAELKAPRLQAVEVGGRAAVFVSKDDLTTGLLGCPAYGCVGYAPDSAVELVRNIVLYAAGGK